MGSRRSELVSLGSRRKIRFDRGVEPEYGGGEESIGGRGGYETSSSSRGWPIVEDDVNSRYGIEAKNETTTTVGGFHFKEEHVDDKSFGCKTYLCL